MPFITESNNAEPALWKLETVLGALMFACFEGFFPDDGGVDIFRFQIIFVFIIISF